MKKRVFVAYLVPPHIRETLHAWQAAHQTIVARWLKPHNFHVTLVPPWQEVDVPRAGSLLESFVATPFTINLNNIETGPQSREPHLIWASGNSTEELRVHRANLHNLFHQPLIREDFTVHITMARLEKSSTITPIREPISLEFTADTIALMESLGHSEYAVVTSKTLI